MGHFQELNYIQQRDPVSYVVKEGFVPGMRVPGTFYVNDRLKGLIFEELQQVSEWLRIFLCRQQARGVCARCAGMCLGSSVHVHGKGGVGSSMLESKQHDANQQQACMQSSQRVLRVVEAAGSPSALTCLQAVSRGEQGGFLPAVKQLANVAALPGIVKVRGGGL